MTRPYEELGAKVRRLQQIVADVHGYAAIDGVTVHTNANGRLTGLDISARAHAFGPQALIELIMRAYDQSADDVQTRTSAIMAELRDDPTVARIADATIVDTAPPPQIAESRPPPARPVPPQPDQRAPWQTAQAPPQHGWPVAAPTDRSPHQSASTTHHTVEPDPARYHQGYQDYQAAPTIPAASAARAPEWSNRPLYEDDDDDIDPYYQRKSWLV